jgi:hypothetical protein
LKILSFPFSIDSDLVPRRGINKELAQNAVTSAEKNQGEHCNPLYESAGEMDLYASTANSLYVSGDLK